MMSTVSLQDELYEKMSAEHEAFKQELLTKSPTEILDAAYRYAMYEDILMEIDTMDLTDNQCSALLESKSPMALIFDRFQDMETDHMERIYDAIEEEAKSLIHKEKGQDAR